MQSLGTENYLECWRDVKQNSDSFKTIRLSSCCYVGTWWCSFCNLAATAATKAAPRPLPSSDNMRSN